MSLNSKAGDRMRKRINKKSVLSIVAAVLIGSISAADFALAIQMDRGNSLNVEYEQHDMEQYLADGKYDGKDSSLEVTNGDDDYVEDSTNVSSFNILEIVRGEGLGTIGYSIDGFEPVPGDTPEMKHACMDALVNTICGGDQNETKDELPNYVSNFMTQFSDGKIVPFSVPLETNCRGYYKNVGAGNGYYSVVKNTLDKKSHKVKMISKFYSNSSYQSEHLNDYIWVDSDLSVEEIENSTDFDEDNDIAVSNHRKKRYVNNNIFFNNFYIPQSYDGGKYKKSTYDEWKKTHKVNLRTKTCQKLNNTDIEWADLIYISEGSAGFDDRALELYNAATKQTLSKSNYPSLELQSFEQVLKIYDRVVAREDVAIIFDCNQAARGGADTNLKKLITMLFRVNTTEESNGAGRDMFMDYLPSYVNAWKAPGQRTDAQSNLKVGKITEINGYMYQDFPRYEVESDKADYEGVYSYYDINGNLVSSDKPVYFNRNRSNTTDYIYIDEETGKFMVKTDNSGSVYWVDFDGSMGDFAHRFVSWHTKDSSLYSKNGSDAWPMDRSGNEGSYFLKYWWFSSDVTDQGVHTPIYYQYYGWGNYRALTQDDVVEGNYKNQSFSYECALFKGDLVKKAIAGRANKREYTDSKHVEKARHYFFLSANIENGDGVNRTMNGNKVLYINDYELEKGLSSIPINFVARTSENISKIEVIKAVGTNETILTTYNPASTNDITKPNSGLSFNGTGGLSLNLKNETTYTDGVGGKKKPTKDTDHHDLYIYKYSSVTPGITLKLSDLKQGGSSRLKTNNKVILRIFVEPVDGIEKHVDDEIIIVKRDFFMLD